MLRELHPSNTTPDKSAPPSTIPLLSLPVSAAVPGAEKQSPRVDEASPNSTPYLEPPEGRRASWAVNEQAGSRLASLMLAAAPGREQSMEKRSSDVAGPSAAGGSTAKATRELPKETCVVEEHEQDAASSHRHEALLQLADDAGLFRQLPRTGATSTFPASLDPSRPAVGSTVVMKGPFVTLPQGSGLEPLSVAGREEGTGGEGKERRKEQGGGEETVAVRDATDETEARSKLKPGKATSAATATMNLSSMSDDDFLPPPPTRR